MVMVARVGENAALVNLIKVISQTVLLNGGVVRNIESLGDRVLVKSLRAADGQRYSMGRFLQVQFDANPELLRQVEE